jgi:hypothetical protein
VKANEAENIEGKMNRTMIINSALFAISVAVAPAQNRILEPTAQSSTPNIVKPPAEIPSGSVPVACTPFLKQRSGAASLIDCYLKDPSNQNIAWAISWGFNNQYVPWAQWPNWAKQDLVQTFTNTVNWYNGGMVAYNGVLAPDPPQMLNAAYIQQNGGMPVYDEATVAWPIYIGHVALNLAAEIYGWVPWSVHNFDSAGTQELFAHYRYFSNCTQNQYGAVGYCLEGGSTPANATYAFKFFKSHNLIGSTKADTITRVLDWARWNLNHSGGRGFDANFQYFGYWGQPPVSRVIEGTVVTDPATPLDWKINPRHWTAGCGGTSYFLSVIFRAVNMPVTTAAAGDGHMTASFMSENLYLSHGDDPYGQDMKSDAPTSMLPIGKATYDQWFPDNDPVTAALNTGRRNVEINVQYPSAWTLNLYCSDIANGKDHATGRVYNEYFYRFYTVPQAESLGVWQRLDQKMVNYACAM